MQSLANGLFPVCTPDWVTISSPSKIQPSEWAKLAKQHETMSLRHLAKKYGVSHETVNRALKELRTNSPQK